MIFLLLLFYEATVCFCVKNSILIHKPHTIFLPLNTILCSPIFPIDSEVNESFCPSSFRGRISLHMLSSLAKDVFPNFSYNHHTKRLVIF